MATFRRIPLYFLDGGRQKANSYGNNAGWLCPCGEPLVGRSSLSSGMSATADAYIGFWLIRET